MGTGRPSVMTPNVIEAVLTAIAKGVTITGAVAGAGIGYMTWRDHVRRDPELQQALETAEAMAEARCIEILNAAMPTNWQAAAWWLERRRPQQYGRQERLMVLRALGTEVAGLGDEELRALAYGGIEGDGEVIDVEATVQEAE